MAARKMKLESNIVICRKCNRNVDLDRQSRLAQTNRVRDVICPHCGHVIGTLN